MGKKWVSVAVSCCVEMQMFGAWLWHRYRAVPGMPHISQQTIRKTGTCAPRDICSRLLQRGSLHSWSFANATSFAARTDSEFNYFVFLAGSIAFSWKQNMSWLFCKPVRAETRSAPQSTSLLVYGDSKVGSADENQKGALLCNWCGEGMDIGLGRGGPKE